MQADSGPQVLYWLAEARCRDVGINAECLMFTTRHQIGPNELTKVEYA